jgi:hypothetical protein
MSTYRNKEGYRDMVAGQAIREVEKEERQKEKKRKELIGVMQQIVSMVGLEIVEIRLRDKYTGKEY